MPWLLGPPDGRYLLRDPGGQLSGAEPQPTHVLVFATLAAPRRLGRFAARRRAAAPLPEPAPVSSSRATVIEAATPLAGAEQAKRWLAEAGEDELATAMLVLTRVLDTFRAVTADAGVRAPARAELLVARVGYGDGEQVADGRWSEARELLPPPPSRRRAKLLEPQARLAAALGRRTPPLLCEELELRARLDLDSNRPRAAALQLTVALDAALAELTPAMAADMESRLAQLAGRIDAATAAAAAALHGDLTSAELESVKLTLERLEAALRARAAAGA
ncbi:MAG TPA: hypothetical protein VME01_07505 [Solirubrobacteraceae bacterium]|nr:hypothetical protein [Solirubrobacteraceae bacterium]